MFIAIETEKGHTVLPIDSIVRIEDTGDTSCKVVYGENYASFDGIERAGDVCLRINKMLASPSTEHALTRLRATSKAAG